MEICLDQHASSNAPVSLEYSLTQSYDNITGSVVVPKHLTDNISVQDGHCVMLSHRSSVWARPDN
jgi:hypothetical protein